MELVNQLINYCSPTLAGIKTGNLFSIKSGGEEIKEEIKKLNKVFVKKGLRLISLRQKNGVTLIYLYRPGRLEKELELPEVKSILEENGYPCGDSDRCVVELIRRLLYGESFPHEIGVFLGYPPKDVRGFMNDPNEGVKCIGCWKVYDNQKEAERMFEKYNICSAIYCRELRRGKAIDYLTVDEKRFRDNKVVN